MKNRVADYYLLLLASLLIITSCKPTSTELTPQMKEYRLSEVVNELTEINSQGLVGSLTSDDSTLIVTISEEEWQAASIEEQNHILEELGSAWVEVSEKIGVKGDDLQRLRAVAVDRFQQEQAHWSASTGVTRP
jgi:Ser/Thr protein kinase RdoA (MazF antagonist)